MNNPGIHQVLRFSKNNLYRGDMIYDINLSTKKKKMIDPNDSTRSKNFNDSFTSEELLRKVFCEGKLVYKSPKITDIKMKLDKDLKMLDESHKRLENPHYYPIGLEESLFNMKKNMILKLRK